MHETESFFGQKDNGICNVPTDSVEFEVPSVGPSPLVPICTWDLLPQRLQASLVNSHLVRNVRRNSSPLHNDRRISRRRMMRIFSIVQHGC